MTMMRMLDSGGSAAVLAADAAPMEVWLLLLVLLVVAAALLLVPGTGADPRRWLRRTGPRAPESEGAAGATDWAAGGSAEWDAETPRRGVAVTGAART